MGLNDNNTTYSVDVYDPITGYWLRTLDRGEDEKLARDLVKMLQAAQDHQVRLVIESEEYFDSEQS